MSSMSKPPTIGTLVSPVVTTRRHPFSYGAYAAAVVTGGSYLFNFPIHILDGTEGWAQNVWALQILVGGLVALLALLVNPRMHPHWPDLADLIRIEGFGSLLCGFGYICYVLAAWGSTNTPIAGTIATACLAAARCWRGWQGIREANKLDKYVQLAQFTKAAVTRALGDAKLNGV